MSRTWTRCATILAGSGAAILGYSLIEARMPILRRVDVPVLAPGERPLSILHLSDLHLTSQTRSRVAWVRSLADLKPDVVINTGDNLSFASGLEPLGEALEPFTHLPGAFVLGDHDYHSTVLRSPTRYLRSDPRTADRSQQRARIAELPWRALRAMLTGGGWADLTNARGILPVGRRYLELVGVDDPHADQDRYPASAAEPVPSGRQPVRSTSGAPLRLGLTHAPYRRVLDAMVSDGVDLALAGHTHGGQLCLPGIGALVTNCDIDRGRAKGLSRYPDGASAAGRVDDAGRPGLFLHVSAGLGTSPYTPVRLSCRPEASLLTLVPASG